jgi:thymidine phosphorylase
MKKEDDAVFLAQLMVETGERMGKEMVALITNMDQPLGRMVGNALEVKESIEVLQGRGPADLRELCIDLAAWMLFLGRASESISDAKRLAKDLLASGKAFAKFREMTSMQGGDTRVIDDPSRLPATQHQVEVRSPESGFVAAIQCEHVGTACVVLGGGRERKEDSVDPAVGIEVHKKIGDPVVAGEPLCTIHCHSEAQAWRARQLLDSSFRISTAPPNAMTMIHRVIFPRGASAAGPGLT